MRKLASMFSIGFGLACCNVFLGALAHAQSAAIIASCDGCHGKNGISTMSNVPTIGGVSAFIIQDHMLLYKNEERPCRMMCAFAQALSEDEISGIAQHYAAQEFIAAVQEFDAEKAAAGAKIHRAKCERCHWDGGSDAGDDAAMLAGQWMPYLKQAFADFASGERVPLEDKMTEKMNALDAAQTEALIHYYASQQ